MLSSKEANVYEGNKYIDDKRSIFSDYHVMKKQRLNDDNGSNDSNDGNDGNGRYLNYIFNWELELVRKAHNLLELLAQAII